jgi:hypothetical protein
VKKQRDGPHLCARCAFRATAWLEELQPSQTPGCLETIEIRPLQSPKSRRAERRRTAPLQLPLRLASGNTILCILSYAKRAGRPARSIVDKLSLSR